MFQSFDLHTIVLLTYICLLCWAAISDFTKMRIPNAIVLSLLILYPAHVAFSPAEIDWVWALVPAVIIFGIGFLLFAFAGMGGADVKLITVVALWSGSENFMVLLIAIAIISLAQVPVSGFIVSMKISRELVEERHAGEVGVLQGARIFGSALAGLRFMHIKQHWIPYGVAIAGAGIYVAGTSLMVTG